MNQSVIDEFDIEQIVPGFTAPTASPHNSDRATIEAANQNTRHWHSQVPGSLEPGSSTHLREICRMFRDTFNPYRPSVLDWPRLDPETLQRIVSLPIWDIAVQTEGRARLRISAYAKTLANPDLRDALALNAWEESRHKEVLSRMVAAYGIPLARAAPYKYPRDAEWAYLVTGYSECIDSFFAFGLFELARRSTFFPPELVETFEPVMQEECRHILLFANWVAWHRSRLSWWRRIRFEFRVLAAWCILGWQRIGLVRTIDADGREHKQDYNFTVSSAKSVSAAEVSVHEVMTVCLQENDRRFAGYDARLLRPTMMPGIVRFALRFLRRPKKENDVTG